MRVITGSARGRRLKELQGMETRPTTARVKESVFNIVQFRVEGRRVLDLFAGTGQMGIEALSRGAKTATFLDRRPDAVRLVRENLNLCGFTGRANVVQGDALEFLSRTKETFDLIFLDPPYGTELLKNALESIAKFDILSDHGIILCESSVTETFPELPEPYQMGRVYRYGKIKITAYEKNLPALPNGEQG
jgi:16S rRNA (guanine966-N2)-methyltransferase